MDLKNLILTKYNIVIDNLNIIKTILPLLNKNDNLDDDICYNIKNLLNSLEIKNNFEQIKNVIVTETKNKINNNNYDNLLIKNEINNNNNNYNDSNISKNQIKDIDNNNYNKNTILNNNRINNESPKWSEIMEKEEEKEEKIKNLNKNISKNEYNDNDNKNDSKNKSKKEEQINKQVLIKQYSFIKFLTTGLTHIWELHQDKYINMIYDIKLSITNEIFIQLKYDKKSNLIGLYTDHKYTWYEINENEKMIKYIDTKNSTRFLIYNFISDNVSVRTTKIQNKQ